MPPWFALVDHKKSTGPGIWSQCRARSRTQLASSLSRTPVCPQWWRPRQTAGKLSPAPCTALAPYSWPCGFLVIHQGKPWRHHVELMSCKTRINSYLDSHLVATGFAAFDRIWIYWILVYSYLLNSINFIAIHSILLMPCWPMVADWMWVGKYDAYTGWTWDYAWYCMNLHDMHDS